VVAAVGTGVGEAVDGAGVGSGAVKSEEGGSKVGGFAEAGVTPY